MNATLVKVGGSLLEYPEKLKSLCVTLGDLAKKHNLVVVPGGGQFADVVRSLDETFSLSCNVSHTMAILGMDQYGLLLSNLIPHSVIVRTLQETERVLDCGCLSIFLPSELFLKEDPLDNCWDVTSDSIAVYLASQMLISKVLLVKDVDGIFLNDPKSEPESKPFKNLSANELAAMNRFTSVDRAMAKLLLKTSIECFIVNGLFPERIVSILNGCETIGTKLQ